VTDALNGSPIGNAVVTAHDINGNQVASTSTDASGQYETPLLATGQYYAKASPATGYAAEVYQEVLCLVGCDVRTGTRVSVPLNVTVPSINFTVSPLASILGTVRDASNQPISGVDVVIFDTSANPLKTVSTGANGQFAATGLPSGQYYVRTQNSSGYGDVLFDRIGCPSGCDVTTGTPVSVAIGQAATTNFQLPDNTQTGTDATSYPRDAVTGESRWSVSFAEIIGGGRTTITTTDTAPPLPAGFQIGDPPMYFDVSTTAGYVAPITICVSYDGLTFNDPNDIRLIHHDSGTWVDVTNSLDTTARVVCGSTLHLSPFAIVERTIATPNLTWPAPAGIVYGTALGAAQLNATADAPGTIVYSPPAGTLLAAGVQTLSATFVPDDPGAYESVSATVTIAVARATPVLQWLPPPPVDYPAALGPAQLNATASVAGTFTYSPSGGTVLPIGDDHVLNAVFVPADAHNYEGATISATVDVLKNVKKPSIKLKAPKASTKWAIGSVQTIEWNQHVWDGARLRIELSRDQGSSWTTIADLVDVDAAAKSGTLAWTVTGPSTSSGQIRVTLIGEPAVSDSSAVFTIKP
jgi:hypothetical protein